MARPSAAVDNLKKNLSKAEIEQRKNAEKATLSGIAMRMFGDVKGDAVAKKEFRRVAEILSAVGKNDALYEAVINVYCLHKSDILRYTNYRNSAENDLIELEKLDLPLVEKLEIKDKLLKSISNYDRQIQSFHKKRFDIEKETGFTVASALRSIPKKVEQARSPLMDILADD